MSAALRVPLTDNFNMIEFDEQNFDSTKRKIEPIYRGLYIVMPICFYSLTKITS